jgi:hypothetical protein
VQIIRDLYCLARETVGAISEGFALGLRSCSDGPPGPDEITHGPAWGSGKDLPVTASVIKWGLDTILTDEARYGLVTSSADGEATGPPAEERPAANPGIRPPVAAGHPNGWAAPILDLHDRGLLKLEWVAAFGLSQWIAGEPCDAPTYFSSIVRDLEHLAK